MTKNYTSVPRYLGVVFERRAVSGKLVPEPCRSPGDSAGVQNLGGPRTERLIPLGKVASSSLARGSHRHLSFPHPRCEPQLLIPPDRTFPDSRPFPWLHTYWTAHSSQLPSILRLPVVTDCRFQSPKYPIASHLCDRPHPTQTTTSGLPDLRPYFTTPSSTKSPIGARYSRIDLENRVSSFVQWTPAWRRFPSP